MVGFLARTLRDPRADNALRLATAWGAGQTIDGLDALRHAIAVAHILGWHTPDAPPQVVAACLLHAIPQWPMASEDVHALVEAHCGVEARMLLTALRDEQAVLAAPSDRAVEARVRLLRTMPWLATSTLAFKITALQRARGRAASGRDAEAALRQGPSQDLHPLYLRQLQELTAAVVPKRMSSTYSHLLDLLDQCVPATTAAASR